VGITQTRKRPSGKESQLAFSGGLLLKTFLCVPVFLFSLKSCILRAEQEAVMRVMNFLEESAG